jgi:hypothetical protein
MSWDRRTPKQQHHDVDRALRSQLVDAVGPFSPYWRERFAELGLAPSSVATRDKLATVPPVGERDLCVDGDPARAAGLVLQAGESGWALHADGPRLRRALRHRLFRPGSYSAVVEADTRPTTYVEAGLAFRYPLASTRSDLDVIARAGARLWQVLGLTRADVVVAALPRARTAVLQALELAALGGGSPALYPGDVADDVAAALALVPATVLVVGAATGAVQVDDLDEAGARLSDVRLVLVAGAPSEDERYAVVEALDRAGVGAEIRAVHVPDGHRLAWGECAQGEGLHTYPDLEHLELVDPETGDPTDGPGEVVLTQLGLRGSAQVRWRTGDLAEALVTDTCGCGRTVPRLLGVERGALVPTLALRTGVRPVDLRGVTAGLAGRPDLVDWRVVVGTSPRDGAHELVVHVVTQPGTDPADAAVAVARDVRSAAGLLPTQVVVDDALPSGAALTRRVLIRA